MSAIRPKFILCDMDGTLVDTEGIKCEAWRLAVWDVQGTEPDQLDHIAVYSTLAGAPGPEIGTALVQYYGLSVSGDALHQGREEHRRRFYANADALRSRVSAPVVELVKRLRDGFTVMGGGSTVLVTTASDEQVEQVMAATRLSELFDHIVCGLEKSATNPACYRAALDLLDADALDCVAIEDTANGYRAAHALGIPCLLIPNEYTRDQRV
jgi:beta-phosphoglucomutase-like phosphatase (HAD superfamily)